MSEKNLIVPALSVYGSLTLFYIGTIMISLRDVGTDIGAALESESFLLSFSARSVGAFLCLLIFGLVLARHALAQAFAWFLLGGVALVLALDTTGQSTGAVVWVIVCVAIALHAWGAILVRRAVGA